LSRCLASLLSTPESDARISMLGICAIHPNRRWSGTGFQLSGTRKKFIGTRKFRNSGSR
jgi:hypothetical protein